MFNVNHKISWRLVAPQRRCFGRIKLELLCLIYRWQLVVGRVPRELTATIAAIALIIKIKLNKAAGCVLRTARDGVGLNCQRLVVGKEVNDIEVAGGDGVAPHIRSSIREKTGNRWMEEDYE